MCSSCAGFIAEPLRDEGGALTTAAAAVAVAEAYPAAKGPPAACVVVRDARLLETKLMFKFRNTYVHFWNVLRESIWISYLYLRYCLPESILRYLPDSGEMYWVSYRRYFSKYLPQPWFICFCHKILDTRHHCNHPCMLTMELSISGVLGVWPPEMPGCGANSDDGGTARWTLSDIPDWGWLWWGTFSWWKTFSGVQDSTWWLSLNQQR